MQKAMLDPAPKQEKSDASNANSAPTLLPSALPLLNRFHVALPPAPKESKTKHGKLLTGVGGNRSVESAASVSRFAGMGFADNFSK
jgi:hypothetical protein